jgi:hypothetical protein
LGRRREMMDNETIELIELGNGYYGVKVVINNPWKDQRIKWSKIKNPESWSASQTIEIIDNDESENAE